MDSLDSLGVDPCAFYLNDVSEQLPFLHGEMRLLGIEGNVEPSAFYEHSQQVRHMLLVQLGKCSDVIEVDHQNLALLLSKCYVHGALKCCSYVHEPEWHFCVHEHSPRHGKRNIFLIFKCTTI